MKKLYYVLLKGLYLSVVPLPILYVIAAKAQVVLFPSILFISVYCAAGYVLSAYLSPRKLLYFIALTAANILINVLLMPYGLWNIVMAILATAGLTVGSFNNWGDENTRLVDTRILAAGLTIAAIMYFVAFLSVLNPIMPAIGYTAYGFLCVSLLLVNRSSVRQNTGSQQKRVMQGNQTLTLVFIILLSVLAFITPISRAIGAAIKWVIFFLYSIFGNRGQTAQQNSSGGEITGDLSEVVGGEAATLPHWLEVAGNIFLYALTIAGLLAIAAFFLWALYKMFVAIWAKIKAMFARDNGEFDEYTEESEQMISSASLGKMFREEVAKRIRKVFTAPVRFSALNPREKVRYLYQRILSEGEKVTKEAQSMTPEELCRRLEKDKEFGALYDRARYSEHGISETEAVKYREYLKS